MSVPDSNAIYDEHIAPLMDQVIRVCQAHKIALLASFCLYDAKGEPLLCTTSLLSDAYRPASRQRIACLVLLNDARVERLPEASQEAVH